MSEIKISDILADVIRNFIQVVKLILESRSQVMFH